MKKTLTFSFAILLTGMLFAQIPYANGIDAERTYQTVQKELSPSVRASLNQHLEKRRNTEDGFRGGLQFYWAGFFDAVENSGSSPILTLGLLWQDSTALIADPTSDFYWNTHAYDQIYDPNSNLINDVLITSNLDIPFQSGNQYTIDSMEMYFLYERVSAPSVVDTLRIYVFNESNMNEFSFTDGTDVAFGSFSSSRFEPQTGILQEYEILLTEADTATATIAFRTLGINTLTLNKNKKLGFAFHFISGQTWSTGDVLFDNNTLGPGTLNNFDLLTFEEDEGLEPLSAITDDPALNMGGLVPSSVLYNIDTLGWNGTYITSFAYTAPMQNEHVFMYVHTAPIGAHFISGTTVNPCEVQFSDLSNVPNPDSYLWQFGDGSISLDQNPTYTYANNDTYVVDFEVEDDAGTSFNKSAAVVVTNCATGLDDINGLVGFDVYPNPANAVINIDLELNHSNDLQLSVLDITGKLLYSRNIENTTSFHNTLDVSNLNSGMYVVRLQDNNSVTSRNFVVNH